MDLLLVCRIVRVKSVFGVGKGFEELFGLFLSDKQLFKELVDLLGYVGLLLS